MKGELCSPAFEELKVRRKGRQGKLTEGKGSVHLNSSLMKVLLYTSVW